MSASSPSQHRDDALSRQIEQIRRERQRLKRSVDASADVFDRAAYTRPPNRPRFRPLILFSAVAFAAVVQPQPPEPYRPQVSAAPVIQAQTAAARRADALVIHIRAMRATRVRVVVDGMPLDWQPLRPGDEFVSRPRRQLVLEADDGGALSAVVNGHKVSLGPAGHAVAVRLTTERPYPEALEAVWAK